MLVITLFVTLLSILVHGVFFLFAIYKIACALLYRRETVSVSLPTRPEVVVIIPVKDDWAILTSLRDTLAMDYPNYRVVVVDDSKDMKLPEALSSLAQTDDRLIILHREKPVGRKGGAIDHVLGYLSPEAPEYVAVLDADHRPPRDFLTKAVSLALNSGSPCVAGWQRHNIGDWGLFGSAYRAFWGAARVNLGARRQIGAAPIFGGSASLFRYSWLRIKGFGSSITEDWNLTLRAYIEDGPVIRFCDDLYVNAAIPVGFAWYVRQQIRWAEGTTRDLRRFFWRLLRSPLPWITKTGLLFQGLEYLQAPLVILSIVITPLAILMALGPAFPLWIMVGLLALYFAGWASKIIRGAISEGYGPLRLMKTVIFAHSLLYVMLPVYTWAALRGLFLGDGEWYVTRRRDIEKNHEA